jgi:hypothetical protein
LGLGGSMNQDNFIIRHAAGSYWIIKTKQSDQDYIPPYKLNESGYFILKQLMSGKSIDDTSVITSIEYHISKQEALSDINEFVKILDSKGILNM